MSLKNVQVETGALRVGAPDFAKSVVTDLTGSGIISCPGVSVFGASLSVGIAKATVSIGPAVALALPMSLWVDGISQFNGIVNFFGAKNSFGICTKLGATIKNAISLKNGVSVGNGLSTDNALKCDNAVLFVAGPIQCAWLDAKIAAAMASPPKGFDMHHPTKKGWRLTHICLEGPEAAVYHRGILKDSEFIELPDYWKGLVRSETITVQLTPIGTYQYLYYTVAQNRIIVKNHSNVPTHCSYIVYGERKDVDKIVVEYKGKIEDYPGRDQRSIVGYHYDYREGVNG